MTSARSEQPDKANSLLHRPLSRRTAVRAGLAAGTVAASSLLLPRSLFAQAATPEASPASSSGVLKSTVEGVPDAFTRTPTPFKSVASIPGSGDKVRMLTISYSPPPTEKKNNTYWQEIEKRLGAEWDPTLVPVASYGEKTAAIIASGDMPELFYLLVTSTAPIIAKSISQGAFTDLTPYLTGDAIKDYPNLTLYPSYLWDNVRIEGKIFGVPKPVLRSNDTSFYRTDWLKKLGLGEPKTTDDVHNMLVAMSKNDPDGNGNADTWGTTAYSGSWNMFVWNQMFSVPYGWRLNDDGTLTNQIETDEYRQSLEFTQRLQADGAFHPDAVSMEYDVAKDSFVSGKVGLYDDGFAAFFGEGSLLQKGQEFNKAATFAPLVTASANGKPGVTYAGQGFFGSVGIPSSVKDEGRIKELLRIMDYLCAPFGNEESNFLRYGLAEDHDVKPDGSMEKNDKGVSDISALVYPFLSENYFYYPGVEGEAARAQQLNEQMAKVAITNPTAGLVSPTSIAKSAELAQLGTDSVTAIVTGRESIDSLDNYIQQWKSRGGDDIRRELEAAIKAKKGS
ncbi:MAG: hypothetical protein ACR2OE_16640 [Thermomicrobiales bacterium]